MMRLTPKEVEFVRELRDEKLKREEREVLMKEMWEKVEEAKPDWEKVVAIKRDYMERTKHLYS